jgi:YgiT-type zinc finger domain-containing protein
MKCIICKHGETVAAATTVTLERGGMTLVFKSVPAEVCDNCGEEYVSDETTRRLLTQAEEAVSRGVEVEVRAYAAA